MKYALTCLAGLTAVGLVALAPARHRYGGYAYRHRPYYYDRYSYGYGPRWRYRHRYWD
jgi:hypothetical protein